MKENADVWVLCENTPVVVSTHSLRPANDSEALSQSYPERTANRSPGEIIGEDQRFVDARLPDPEAPEDADPTIPEDEVNPADIPIPTVFEDDDPIDEDEEPARPSSSLARTRRSATFGPNVPRNVRARTETGLSTDEGSGSVPGTPADFPVEIPCRCSRFGGRSSVARIGGIWDPR